MPLKISPEIFNIGLTLKNEHFIKEINEKDQDQKLFQNDIYHLIKILKNIKKIGYDFVMVPIFQKNSKKERIDLNQDLFHDLNYTQHYKISGREWNTGIIGIFPINAHIESDQIITILEWCEYVGYHALLLSIGNLSINFLSLLLSFLVSIKNGIQIWFELNLESNSINCQWNKWQFVQKVLDNGTCNHKIGIVLNISIDTLKNSEYNFLERFLGEPIKCVIMNSNFVDILNQNSDEIFNLLTKLLRLKIPLSVKLESINYFNSEYLEKTYKNITNYILKLPPLTEQEKYEYNYIDLLQIPLQPLKVDLESIFYEIFERDPVKYKRYQEAMNLCISDILKKKSQVKILVVGAGRGALVKSLINALKELNVSFFKIVCVEKNFNAIITLNSRILLEKDEYWQQIKIIHSDVRHIEFEQKFDLIVSELLGSFGDNELSPECLNAAQKFLENDGIMIPQSYTSFIEPISCKKVWDKIKRLSSNNSLETPFVTKLKSLYRISLEGPKKVFSFNHPIENFIDDLNNIHVSLNFKARENSILHGFLGYFQCNLYKNIGFSTIPENFSKGLISWFEFFIPLTSQISILRNDIITLNIWRKSNKNKVWYEWLLTNPSVTPIHNSNGQKFHISL